MLEGRLGNDEKLGIGKEEIGENSGTKRQKQERIGLLTKEVDRTGSTPYPGLIGINGKETQTNNLDSDWVRWKGSSDEAFSVNYLRKLNDNNFEQNPMWKDIVWCGLAGDFYMDGYLLPRCMACLGEVLWAIGCLICIAYGSEDVSSSLEWLLELALQSLSHHRFIVESDYRQVVDWIKGTVELPRVFSSRMQEIVVLMQEKGLIMCLISRCCNVQGDKLGVLFEPYFIWLLNVNRSTHPKTLTTSSMEEEPTVNSLSDGYSTGTGLAAEIICAHSCLFTPFSLQQIPREMHEIHKVLVAPLSFGFAVFMVHLATILITGTSINPDRSSGAAVMFNQDKFFTLYNCF
ncbi:hypothetical protein V6N13_024830 [Hibiscus sabdariffa]